MYKQCYIAVEPDGLWYVLYPDNTVAWPDGYKSERAAMKTLNWLMKEDGVSGDTTILER